MKENAAQIVVKVENMTVNSGRPVPNQFLITTDQGQVFQSYECIIAIKYNDGRVQLDSSYWDYSNTTGRYRNEFLGEDKKETQRKINAGVYELLNLN